jgi:hypothetical protein
MLLRLYISVLTPRININALIVEYDVCRVRVQTSHGVREQKEVKSLWPPL